MSIERAAAFEPRVQQALEALHTTIAERYPMGTFEVARGLEEPENVDLVTIVDLDEELDLVIERLVEMQVDERIPVHVILFRTPARVLVDVRSLPRWRSLARHLTDVGREEIREQAV